MPGNPTPEQVDRFILDNIDSVPHLESLLLLWTGRSTRWTAAGLASRLYVPAEAAQKILQELAQRELIAAIPEIPAQYCYQSKSEQLDRMMEAVDSTYRRELVRISNLIHSKASRAVREFAKAFRFTKEQD